MQRGCKFRGKIDAKLPRVETLSQAENTDGQKLEPTIPKEGGWNKHTARLGTELRIGSIYSHQIAF